MGLLRLAEDLRAAGCEVHKVAFHAGDLVYGLRGIPVTSYRAGMDQWAAWLREFVGRQDFDSLLLYNDERQFNRVARELALAGELGDIEIFVVEQGLIRPLHVTAFSLNSYPDWRGIDVVWKDRAKHPLCMTLRRFPPQDRRVSTRIKISKMALYGMLAVAGRFLYPQYQDQNRVSGSYHAWSAFLSLLRYNLSCLDSRRLHRALGDPLGSRRPFFLLPLQVGHDVQLLCRSPFRSIAEVLDQVVGSFVENAPQDSALVVKVHPMDRGFRSSRDDLQKFLGRLLKDRLLLVDRVPLDSLLRSVRGVVTVNSSVGLTALRYLAPVKALGTAIYDRQGLTYGGDLDDFWCAAGQVRPSQEDVDRFVNLLENTIQGRGSLARRCYENGSRSGIFWPQEFSSRLGLGGGREP